MSYNSAPIEFVAVEATLVKTEVVNVKLAPGVIVVEGDVVMLSRIVEKTPDVEVTEFGDVVDFPSPGSVADGAIGEGTERLRDF